MKIELSASKLLLEVLAVAFFNGVLSSFQSAYAQQTLLTPAQERQIINVSENANAVIIEEYERMLALRQQLYSLVYSPDASEAEIDEAYSQYQTSVLRVNELTFEKHLEFRNILPPELRQPFVRVLQENFAETVSEISEDEAVSDPSSD